jgi:outer membrane biosynthesis protein TonB
MEAILNHGDSKNRQRSLIASIIIHFILLLLLLIPVFRFPIPPPGQEGILISLGEPDEGQGDAVAEASAAPKERTSVDEPQSEEEAEPAPQTQQEVAKKAAVQEKVTDVRTKDVVVSEEEKQRRREAELERQRQAQLEEARRKAAEEEARKQAEYEKQKNTYGDLLGSGEGKGQTGTQGNQGDPQGDPNAKALQGISSGSGMVGGGLGDRGVLSEPTISDRSQKTGRVVVRVCVDRTGKVISADYTQRGSTTTDAELRDLAERSSRLFRFTPFDIEKQCGTITIDFKVR